MEVKNVSAGPIECCGRLLAPGQSFDFPAERFHAWVSAGSENRRRAVEHFEIDGERPDSDTIAAARAAGYAIPYPASERPDPPADPGGGGEDGAQDAPDPRDAKLPRADRIKAMMRALDPSTDGHFTQDGKPTVFALEAGTGIEDIRSPERDALWAEVERVGG